MPRTGKRALVHNLFLALVPGAWAVDILSTHAGIPSGDVGIFRIKRWDAHFQRVHAAPGVVKLLEYSFLIQQTEGRSAGACTVLCSGQAILLFCESRLEIKISQRNSSAFHGGVHLLGDAHHHFQEPSTAPGPWICTATSWSQMQTSSSLHPTDPAAFLSGWQRIPQGDPRTGPQEARRGGTGSCPASLDRVGAILPALETRVHGLPSCPQNVACAAAPQTRTPGWRSVCPR